MEKYSLAPNEGIILQYDGVYHNGNHSEIVLTNQNLICVETNVKLLKKNTYNVLKFPVNQIKIVNGQVQASVIKEDDDWTLQVLLKNGTEKFQFFGEFYERTKKKQIANQWVEQISILLTGKSAEKIVDTSLVGGVKNVLGSIGINVKTKTPENITTKCIGCRASLAGQKGQTIRCKYCDTEQTL